MKINCVNYNYLNNKQNCYDNKTANNSNTSISFNASKFYMDHLTDAELERLSKYAASLKENRISENMLLGPTFNTIEKVMKLGSPFNTIQEFVQLALRAESGVTTETVLKAMYFSSLCAERYPNENYANEVNEALNQIETSEPAILEWLSANPLWSYPNVLQRQADWISVNEAIIKECDEREKTVNLKIQTLDDKFEKKYTELLNEIQKERQERKDDVARLSKSIGQLRDSIPTPTAFHWWGNPIDFSDSSRI